MSPLRRGPDISIGIIGTENTHVDHIIQYLNVERNHPGVRVVALAGGTTERNRALAEIGGIEIIVNDVSDLVGQADAFFVGHRDGALHADHAVPLLQTGHPVMVEKPLACGVADARKIIDAALAGNAPLTSYSPLRFLPEADALENALGTIGPLRSLSVGGPADPTSEYGGIFFYGIHPVDIALRLAHGAIGDVRLERAAESLVASVVVGDAVVTFTFVLPQNGRRIPFHALAVGSQGVHTVPEFDLAGNYVAPGLEAFLGMVESGSIPIPYKELLRPIELLSAIARAAESLGIVPLPR